MNDWGEGNDLHEKYEDEIMKAASDFQPEDVEGAVYDPQYEEGAALMDTFDDDNQETDEVSARVGVEDK